MNELIIVRHGETEGNSAVRLYGRTDIALSDLGREQMRRAGAALRGMDFRAVYASPLSRSRESAAIIAGAAGAATTIISEFREIDFGNWEGWSFEEASVCDPENYGAYKKGFHDFQFPGGDSKPDFFERVAQAALRVFSDSQLPALAALHKGVIRGLMAGLLGVPVRDLGALSIELGSIHRMKKMENGWLLVSENETGHLGETRIPESK
jgi:broad specificity phosphatase PhoE